MINCNADKNVTSSAKSLRRKKTAEACGCITNVYGCLNDVNRDLIFSQAEPLRSCPEGKQPLGFHEILFS